MKNIIQFQNKKIAGEKISMVTCYDYWTAKIINASPIDCILVGDSAAMVMHGFESTVSMDVDTMALHIAAVKRGAPDKFIIGDMPFLAHRKDKATTMAAVDKLMKAGANAIKIEAQAGHEKVIQFIVDSGVPVMGHVGLIPQSVNQLGGYKVQGKETSSSLGLLALTKALEEAGCFSIVIECVPESLATKMTNQLNIPTIGIGSGAETDGQVLVLQDLLGGQSEFMPKFVRQFANIEDTISKALTNYHATVTTKDFPSHSEIYH